MNFTNLLKKNNIVLLDGAMGTMLQPDYLKAGDIPELLNITHPEVITNIHKAYIKAGSQIIYTNTFGANSKKLPPEHALEDIISAAISVAKEATKNTDCLIAYDMGPVGELLEPLGSITFEEAYSIFAQQAKLASKYGADVIVVETVSDLYEMKSAILAIKENTKLPIIATMTFEENLRTFMGCTIPSMVATLEGLSVEALGINCSLEPEKLLPHIQQLMQYASLPVIIKLNAGLPDNQGSFSADIDSYTRLYKEFITMGVSLIGGCCGTTPEYIKSLSRFKGLPTHTHPKKPISCVCTPSKFIKIDNIKIIGERLNPTGNPTMQDALINERFNPIATQAIEQIKAGAEILDINCGLPQINEKIIIPKVIKYLQSITDAPLQIDSSDPDAIASALRAYNGKAIVNSVNGDEKVLDSVLPTVKKYGAAVIGLTLDENGIPKTQDERIKIAEKIIQRAKDYGIKPTDIFIDPLTLTVSAEPEQAKITLKTLRYIKNVMGYHTVLGVSNISFGLPNRELINSTFLIGALHNGLTLPIINPNISSNINAIKAFKAIHNLDKGCEDYINTFSKSIPLSMDLKSPKKATDIEYCIRNGLKEECSQLTRRLLNEHDPLDVVNKYLIPALDKIGKLYEDEKLFLPQLILGAETAKYGFEEVKKAISKKDKFADRGTILLATVKGDIHDIGKNIVKVILENYGYNIIDLGKNVDDKLIVSTIKEKKIKLVGLSALMTTTATNMKKAIIRIKQENLTCKIMVGGAVISPAYAKEIQADYYAKDANSAVRIANKVFSVKK